MRTLLSTEDLEIIEVDNRLHVNFTNEELEQSVRAVIEAGPDIPVLDRKCGDPIPVRKSGCPMGPALCGCWELKQIPQNIPNA